VLSHVKLRIFNTLGQEVKSLVDGIQEAGYESVTWDGSEIASGVYFYRLEAVSVADPAKNFNQVKKMLYIR